ncbi:MAG: DUF29 domain-containing protein [Candidatus Magnetoovum sp. WYHC-5]|nr:DUF29 domain-containing protein [Candidatus Magnetoovum sp. WYHC-5]
MDTQITYNNTDTQETLYEVDFYQWALYNANLLKQGRFTEVDIENVVEELESMGRGEKKELRNRLAILIMHLLKWQYQPQRRSESWKITINTQRVDIEFILKDSPSLKHVVEIVIDEAYKKSGLMFQKETGINKKHLPNICPYNFEQLIDYDFLPE